MDQPLPRLITNWRAAEDNAAAWMKYWGYSDVRRTGDGTDAGVDIRAGSWLEVAAV